MSKPEPDAAPPKRGRGRPKLDHPKLLVTLRLDDDLVWALKSLGPGWQTKANAMLRKACKLK